MTPERPKVPTLREAAERVLLPCSREGFYSSEPVPRDVIADLRDAIRRDAEERRDLASALRQLGFKVLCERPGYQRYMCEWCTAESPTWADPNGHDEDCHFAALLAKLEGNPQ